MAPQSTPTSPSLRASASPSRMTPERQSTHVPNTSKSSARGGSRSIALRRPALDDELADRLPRRGDHLETGLARLSAELRERARAAADEQHLDVEPPRRVV